MRIRRLEYPGHLQVLTPRRVYDTLAKHLLCAGGHTRRGAGEEASSKSNTYIKWSTVLRQNTAEKKVPVRPVEKTKGDVPSNFGKTYIPSHSAIKKSVHRPVPSWNVLFAFPSHHENNRSLYCTVPSRREISHSPSRAVPFNQLQSSLFYRRVHSCHCFPRQTCQNSPVPSRLEYYRPWKALVVLAYHLLPLTCYIPRSTSKYVVFWRIWMAVFVFWLVTTEHVPIIIYNPWCDEGFCMNRTIKRPNSKTKAHHWCQRKRKYICRMQKQIEHGETGW